MQTVRWTKYMAEKSWKSEKGKWVKWWYVRDTHFWSWKNLCMYGKDRALMRSLLKQKQITDTDKDLGLVTSVTSWLNSSSVRALTDGQTDATKHITVSSLLCCWQNVKSIKDVMEWLIFARGLVDFSPGVPAGGASVQGSFIFICSRVKWCNHFPQQCYTWQETTQDQNSKNCKADIYLASF